MQRLIKIIPFAALIMLLLLTAVAIDEPLSAISEEKSMHIANVAAAAVYNVENDTVVYSHNADAVVNMGSFAKMMTAVCAYELLADRLDETVTVTSDMVKGIPLNFYGYKAGNTVVLRDMFGGLLTRGYNDCAHILACTAKGSIADFVAYMNEKAVKLGMKNTVYVNPTGLDGGVMTTSAADSLIIAKEFYNNPFLIQTANTVAYEGESTFTNRNELLTKGTYFDSRIIGMNTGWTENSGYCTASAVEGEALSYIIVILGGKSVEEKNAAYLLTSELATHALEGYGYIEVIKAEGIVCEVPVRLSTDSDYVTLAPKDSLTLYLPLTVNPKEDFVYSYRLNSDVLDAPVTDGQVVGSYTVSKDGQILGSVDLVTKNSLSRSEFLVMLDNIESFTKSTFFIVTVIAAVVLTIAYFIINAIIRNRRRNRHFGRR